MPRLPIALWSVGGCSRSTGVKRPREGRGTEMFVHEMAGLVVWSHVDTRLDMW
jgi:hypothetical protein